MRIVTIQNDYPVSASRLWALATDYAALSEVMEGLVSFEGLPEGRARTGQRLEVMVSLFGKLPAQPYRIDVLECDNQRMILRSSERGAGVKTWLHSLTVMENETGSRLQDRIEIDAGMLTPVFALWARYLYRARHRPRLRLLESGRY
ncbi:SRPBCC family protein [uncultured Ruegeria sp.]|uniref:SRPBCC family protein n=1 Tax=uncultured Ruegeria sp. TaxID=259304 RepID=UPI002603D520|nr:SRPBCC family protein [uncultured Ruegeria sp.]